jgi:hypothetical protein
MRLFKLLAPCLLAAMLALLPAPLRAAEPAYGSGITVDGNAADWNLAGDFFANMYNAGRPTPNWGGYRILSRLYLRYDCSSHILYALVLDVEGDGFTPFQSPGDAWIKIYGLGWSNNKLIDGDGGGNTTPRSFAWVYQTPGNPATPLVGYEARAQLDEGDYANFEAHLNVGGNTSSTGRHSQGYSIPLNVHCAGDPTVGAEDHPAGFALSPACPNPFNPETSLTVMLPETGFASLKVYDLSGRVVATLLDGMAAAGTRQFRFQAGALPSGVYFAVLKTGTQSATQKLLLVK